MTSDSLAAALRDRAGVRFAQEIPGTGALAAFADATQPFGSAKRLVEAYRTLHLPRFERSADAVRMAAGLKAAGVEI